MRITTLLAAFVLMALPSLAAAECSWGMNQEVTMSCGEGTTWDAETSTCLPTLSS